MSKMEDSGTVLKLIPEFSGEGNVSEWLEKVELVCELMKITDVAAVLPLRLTGSAFAVYQQLPKDKKCKLIEVKQSLIAAFATNSFAAYEQFVSRKLAAGESPDVFLANLRTLAERFGGVSNRTLMCAFVTGLPDGARQVLRAGANMDEMKLDAVLQRARSVLVDSGCGLAGGVTAAAGGPRVEEEGCVAMATGPAAQPGAREKVGCFKCGGPNHFARFCRKGWTPREKSDLKCYVCKEKGHMMRDCQKRTAAKASSENE